MALRDRLRQRGLRLMLDFVPNHTGLDHHWVEDHPEYYVSGSELDLVRGIVAESFWPRAIRRVREQAANFCADDGDYRICRK